MMELKKTLKALVCFCLIACFMVGTFVIGATVDTEATEDVAVAESNTIDIVVAAKDIKKGSKIKTSDVEVKTLKNVNIPPKTISDPKTVIGNYAVEDIYQAEFIRETQYAKTYTPQVSPETVIKPVTKESSYTYVVVTDYVKPNTGEDLAVSLQDIINKNPKRVIYFPDGEYVISKSLLTPSDPEKSVTLLLSNNAVIKADDRFKKTNPPEDSKIGEAFSALVCLGASGNNVNNTSKYGSYYGILGGILDGNGVADGVSVDWGRETFVRNVYIKNAKVGVNIKHGANSGSSDADVDDVIIDCAGIVGSVGVKITGYDNTVSNVRIYDAEIGVDVIGGGEVLRDIRCYYTHSDACASLDKKYEHIIGIREKSTGNFYFRCYAENYATAFQFTGYFTVVDACTAVWTTDEGGKQIAFDSRSGFDLRLSNCRADFCSSRNSQISFVKYGGGKLEGPIYDPDMCTVNVSNAMIRYNIIH